MSGYSTYYQASGITSGLPVIRPALAANMIFELL
jgi:hypothetical protein